MAGRLFVLLPYMEQWRNMKPVKFRRFLSSIVSYIPWPSLRSVRLGFHLGDTTLRIVQFKWGVDTMHPVCAQVFREKKVLFDRDGLNGLKDTPSGGKDLVSLLSKPRDCMSHRH